jgi:hypothetical protein
MRVMGISRTTEGIAICTDVDHCVDVLLIAIPGAPESPLQAVIPAC